MFLEKLLKNTFMKKKVKFTKLANKYQQWILNIELIVEGLDFEITERHNHECITVDFYCIRISDDEKINVYNCELEKTELEILD